jgi:hypothetical protein
MAIEDSDIEEQAKAPKKVTGDEGTVVERDIDELIKAQVRLNQASATGVPHGLRMSKMRPGGSVGW